MFNRNQIVAGVLSAIMFITAMNTFTIVQAGTHKVESLFGTVFPIALKEGLHFPVNPFASFDTFDTRNDKYEVNGINIPTMDRFNSTGNVTVLFRIDGATTPHIKQNYGTAEEYLNKTLRQYLRSIVRDEGRKLEDSRALANSSNVSVMQENTRKRLTEQLDGTGIEVADVLIQDIKFDPRIAEQILQTQERIQREEAKKSEKRIADTNALIAKAEAEGAANREREAADARAYAITQKANAEKQARIAVAEGEAKAIELIAEANIKLTESLTPQILQKQSLDNEAILYSKSRGQVPTTIIGETNLRAIGVPVATAQ